MLRGNCQIANQIDTRYQCTDMKKRKQENSFRNSLEYVTLLSNCNQLILYVFLLNRTYTKCSKDDINESSCRIHQKFSKIQLFKKQNFCNQQTAPEAVVTVFSTPDDGCCDTRNMQSGFAVNKYLHTVASSRIFINIALQFFHSAISLGRYVVKWQNVLSQATMEKKIFKFIFNRKCVVKSTILFFSFSEHIIRNKNNLLFVEHLTVNLTACLEFL